ncbi:hypothetical protein D3C86_935060 [compost metagenome]
MKMKIIKVKNLLVCITIALFQQMNAQTYELHNSINFNSTNDGRDLPDGITWFQPTPLSYGIYRTSGSWLGPNYQQLKIAFETGIIIDGGFLYGKSGTFIQPNGGNVGIGTTNPSKNLDIYGSYATTLKISTGDPSSYPTEIHLGANPDFNKSAIISAPNAAGWYRQDLYFCLANGNNTLSTGLAEAAMVIKSYTTTGFGYVGIGTAIPDEKLTVKGKIHTQEVRVDMLGALVPDYVFAEDYKLKSLQEVEDYIKENKHLPEIPSAKEIEKNGLMLAEMNMNLLKKMEEMTLYMIEMKKENNEMKKDIQKLKQNK